MSKQIDGHKPGRYELVPVGELIPYVNNARTHSDGQIVKLQASIREFGFVNPVLVDGNKNIIAGHGRVEAAKREGISEVPCVFVEHLTDNQRKAYILADNRLAELAEWDIELLNTELFELDFDMAQFGFEEHSPDDYADSFSLKEGDRQPFQTMSFTFSDAQVEDIKSAMSEMKQTSGYKNYEGDNENSNGNALWMVVVEWKQRKT